ncbi:MAG: MATE family efflux transporter [Oscillospiraceae bacterium]|nr:MATE family efflux transporter [Oscillospiraceae bacterium]
MHNSRDMTTGRPGRLLLRFALPLMLGNICQQLYMVADTAIVGRGVGLKALAALGCVDWFNWMLFGIAQGMSHGFSVLMAQKFGEKNGEGLRRTVAQSALLSGVIAVGFIALFQAALPLILRLLQVPAELRGLSELYTRILIAGALPMFFFNFCSAVLRSIGDSKTPLKAMLIASVVNIVLDCVAVFVLHWGIAGAAGATVFSQCVSGFLCARRIWRNAQLRFTRQQLRPDVSLCRALLAMGAPIAGKNIIISVGGMTIQTVVNGFAMSFIAGFTATNKLYGVLEVAAISYGFAVSTYVGQNYGAGQSERIRRGVRTACALALGTSLLIGGGMALFGRSITMLFISAEDAALAAAAGQVAYHYLLCMAAFLPVLYLLFVFQSALQGMGDSISTMIFGLVEFALRVSLALLVSFTGFQYGIFAAEVLSWTGSAVYLFCRWRKQQKTLPPP